MSPTSYRAAPPRTSNISPLKGCVKPCTCSYLRRCSSAVSYRSFTCRLRYLPGFAIVVMLPAFVDVSSVSVFALCPCRALHLQCGGAVVRLTCEGQAGRCHLCLASDGHIDRACSACRCKWRCELHRKEMLITLHGGRVSHALDGPAVGGACAFDRETLWMGQSDQFR